MISPGSSNFEFSIATFRSSYEYLTSIQLTSALFALISCSRETNLFEL